MSCKIFFFFLATTFLISYKKEDSNNKQERKIFPVGKLTPEKFEMDKNFKGTVHWSASETAYFIILDNIYANANLNMIKFAIEEKKPLGVWVYSGSVEIAKLSWE
jgi:hypothetical protein